jgi:NAD(P)-dependent dehydrogenase (short-subunit alcohol dehydrogenase family)
MDNYSMINSFINNLFKLDGKTALITGASSGLGYRFATVLALCGANIIAVGRNKKCLQRLKEDLISINKNFSPIVADIGTEKGLKKLNHEIESNNIDILINNAGVAFNTPIITNNLKNQKTLWQQQINTNLNSVWLITQKVVEQMIKNHVNGSIINISSVAGLARPCHEATAYNISKSALIQLTRSLVNELAPHGIRINAILPGLFKTNMNPIINMSAEDLTNLVPLKRIATPEDLDGTILLLCSNKASNYMTGNLIVVDGGLSVTSL